MGIVFFCFVVMISANTHFAHRGSLLVGCRNALWVVASENLYMVVVGVASWCLLAAPGVHAVVRTASISGSWLQRLPPRRSRAEVGEALVALESAPAILPSRLPPRCRCLHSARAALSAPPLADAPPPAVSLPSAVALPLAASWLLPGCFLAVSWLFSPAAAPAVARSPAAPPSDGFGLDQQAETSTWCWCVRLAPRSGLPGRLYQKRKPTSQNYYVYMPENY